MYRRGSQEMKLKMDEVEGRALSANGAANCRQLQVLGPVTATSAN